MARLEASSNSHDRTWVLDGQLRRLELPDQSTGESRSADIHLVQPLGSHTWMCTLNGGSAAAARWIDASAAGRTAETIGRLAPLGASPDARLLPILALAQDRGAVWLVSELDRGVSLRRLLQLVGISALQAVVIASDVLDALASLHAAGSGHGMLRADNIHVGRDGKIRLGDWAVAATRNGGRTDWPQVDFKAFGALVESLINVARRRGASSAARQDLLATLEEVTGPGTTNGGVPAAREMLGAVIDESDRARARAELAALAANIATIDRRGTAEPPPVGMPLNIPTARASLPPAGAPRARRHVWSRRWTRPVLVLATLLVLGGLVAVEFSVLHDRIGDNVETLLRAPGSADKPVTTPPVASPTADSSAVPGPVGTPRPVPMIAPAAAGAVTSVDLRPLGRCTAGSVCSVRTLIRVWPQTEELQVRWDMVVVDRCTGVQSTAPGGIVEMPAGGDRVDGLVQVALPKGSALAVLAVSTMPARVASAPLLVPAADGAC